MLFNNRNLNSSGDRRLSSYQPSAMSPKIMPGFGGVPRPSISAPSSSPAWTARPVCNTTPPSSSNPASNSEPRCRKHPATHAAIIARHAEAGNLALMKAAVLHARADKFRFNVINYTIIANAHVKYGNPADAFDVFKDMQNHGTAPTNPTLRVALKAAQCLRNKKLAVAKLVDTLSWARSEEIRPPCTRTWNLFLKAFIKLDAVDHAIAALKDMRSSIAGVPMADVWSFNTCISALARNHKLYRALDLFAAMRCGASPVTPDVVTYNSIIEAAVLHTGYLPAGPVSDAEERFTSAILKSMDIHAVTPDIFTDTLLLRLLCRKGATPSVSSVDLIVNNRIPKFSSHPSPEGLTVPDVDQFAPRSKPDKMFFDAAITAYGHAGNKDAVGRLLAAMTESVHPDILTLRAIMTGAGHQGDVAFAQRVLRLMRISGIQCDKFMYTSALAACARANPPDPTTADQLLTEAVYHGVPWCPPMINAAISAYGDNIMRAIDLWRSLKNGTTDPVIQDMLSERPIYDALFRVCGRSVRPDLALRVWYAAKNAQHVKANSSESRIIFSTFMKGVNEVDGEDLLQTHLLKRTYFRLLRTECGVRDSFEWPVERIRIKI